MSADDLMAVIAKVEGQKADLIANRPEAKQQAKLLRAMPAAAKQLRDQIAKGLKGNVVEAGRARVAVRQLLGETITLKPAKDKSHLVAHFQVHQAALINGDLNTRRFCGSGGSIRYLLATIKRPKQFDK
jgi:hypothetical protein